MCLLFWGVARHCEFNLSVSEYFCRPINILDFCSACGFWKQFDPLGPCFEALLDEMRNKVNLCPTMKQDIFRIPVDAPSVMRFSTLAVG